MSALHSKISAMITEEQRSKLLENGRSTANGDSIDPYPVVKLFRPFSKVTYLLTELDPTRPDIAFGLCDLGLGYVELGEVSLGQLGDIPGLRRDENFVAKAPISIYAHQSQRVGSIVAALYRWDGPDADV